MKHAVNSSMLTLLSTPIALRNPCVQQLVVITQMISAEYGKFGSVLLDAMMIQKDNQQTWHLTQHS